MAGDEQEALRVFCICGQKMRVSKAMYGRPGKCIACRQKIRIPFPEEFPEDSNDIHLKDHPEFLRKVKEAREEGDVLELGSTGSVEPTPAKKPRAAKPKDPSRQKDVIALDVLEPLRVLSSLETKIDGQLKALKHYKGSQSPEQEKHEQSQLQSYLSRIRRARVDLEESLQERLAETEIELETTCDRLAEDALTTRLGDLALRDYLKNIERLRVRRDGLEYRKQNLQGWLAVHNPAQAGGYLDLSIEDIPNETTLASLPSAPKDSGPLVHHHVDALREALVERQQAEQRLSELALVKQEGAMPGRGAKDLRDEYKAHGRRAAARVTFYRDRLLQSKKDVASDLKVVEALVELARGHLKSGQASRREFDGIQATLTHLRIELSKTGTLIQRSLSGNTPTEIPRPRGTFIQRLAGAEEKSGLGKDSWLTWGAALLVLVGMFLPTVGPFSPLSVVFGSSFRGSASFGYVFWPVLAALFLGVAGAVPYRLTRGMMLSVFWALVTVIGAAALHQSHYVDGAVAAKIRESGPWLLRPGILAFVLADIAIVVAAGLALVPSKESRLAALILFGGGLLCVAGILTDLGGFFRPDPKTSIGSPEARTVRGRTLHELTITIGNEGRRTLYLSRSSSNLRNAFLYFVERKVGQDSWVPEADVYRTRTDTPRAFVGSADLTVVPPGGTVEYILTLPPGEYRVLLKSEALKSERSSPFNLAKFPNIPTNSPPPPTETPEPAGSSWRDRLYAPEAKLSGIFATPGQEPIFSITMTMADGMVTKREVSLGETLYDEWQVAEYNPDLASVTLNRDGVMLILRTGNPVLLVAP